MLKFKRVNSLEEGCIVVIDDFENDKLLAKEYQGYLFGVEMKKRHEKSSVINGIFEGRTFGFTILRNDTFKKLNMDEYLTLSLALKWRRKVFNKKKSEISEIYKR